MSRPMAGSTVDRAAPGILPRVIDVPRAVVCAAFSRTGKRCRLRQRLGALVATTIALLLFAGTAQAQRDAYSVEVAVADRGAEEQQDAFRLGFRRVLLDNSGDKTLLNRDAVRSALKRSEEYVASVNYRTPPPGTVIASDTPITDLVRQTGQATQLMLVSFDRTLVRQLIDQSAEGGSEPAEGDAPVTSDVPGSALVWLLVQDDGRDIMISDPAAVNVQSRAREIAGAAGISLLFPAGDAEDQQALTVEDMITRDLDRIAAASDRYHQGMVLAGTLSRNGAQGWRGQWVRLLGGAVLENSFDTGSLDQALQDGLSMLSNEGVIDESYRYGGNASSDTEALVWVGSLNSLGDYASMMKFFESLSSVGTVYPKEVNDSAMVFAVLPRSALNEIETAAVRQNWLRRTVPPITEVPGSLSSNADLALEFGR
ncbi:MAG: DUF2066 domain-containing protein [Granulosicoccus sp.]|nr:DUF2066 domain-containing protein [Granulosicoccus sp.]